MMRIPMPMDVTRLEFMLMPDTQWPQDMLQAANRMRGLLGQRLKQQSCFLDAAMAVCKGCVYRRRCHYGTSFETGGEVVLPGGDRFGSIPHCWALQIDQRGLMLHCTLVIVGQEHAHIPSWQHAMAHLPMPIVAVRQQTETNVTLPMPQRWQTITPLRLRKDGKTPKKQHLSATIAATVARKSKALAAMHGLPVPTTHLPEPTVSRVQWHEVSRYSYRLNTMQPMGGWLCAVQWPDDVAAEWLPWLALMCDLGLGRQTSFGMGRLQACTAIVDGAGIATEENHSSTSL